MLNVVTAVQQAQKRRDDVIHQDWTLRTLERVIVAQRLADEYGDAWPEHADEMDRYAFDSPNWQRVPARSLGIEQALTIAELEGLERELARVMAAVQTITGRVASARATGQPPGYVNEVAT